jgi:hypothetical protein
MKNESSIYGVGCGGLRGVRGLAAGLAPVFADAAFLARDTRERDEPDFFGCPVTTFSSGTDSLARATTSGEMSIAAAYSTGGSTLYGATDVAGVTDASSVTGSAVFLTTLAQIKYAPMITATTITMVKKSISIS